MRVTYGFSRSGCNGFSDLVNVYLASLPDKLYVGVGTNDIQSGSQCLVDGAGSQAAAQNEDSLLFRVQSEVLYGVCVQDGMSEQVLAHRITCHDYLFCREEFFHTFVGHANLACLLCQQLVGDTGVGILFLYQRGNTHHARHFQRRTTGIATYTDGHLWAELLDDAPCFPLASYQFQQYGEVLPQMFTVESGNG